MDMMVNIDLKKLPVTINYGQKIMLIGSCFTEHIGNAMQELKFDVMQNPNGILFDPASVCRSLISYTRLAPYKEDDIFLLNEVWNSWQHHSRFSSIDKDQMLLGLNQAQQEAHNFLRNAEWLIITLGSSYSYRLTEAADGPVEMGVANNHRAPAQWFNRHLLEIDETIDLLENCYHQLMHFNPELKIIFTISPVRHIRDGVVENNRSKARLLEAVHSTIDKFDAAYYFPAYELVIDVLRDYRFYDIDMVHPNYQATNYVLEKFTSTCINPDAKPLMEDLKKLGIARRHRAFQPNTNAHREFLRVHAEKAKTLAEKFPFLDLSSEIDYFSKSS
jgi:hypothetical protein